MKDKWKPIDHSGSSFKEFLREEGVLEGSKAVARSRVATVPGNAAEAYY